MKRWITCGGAGADFPGFDNDTIQRALEHAAICGCDVKLTEGEFTLRDSIHIRDNVSIIGSGIDCTVLKKNASRYCNTAAFCGFGHREIIVTDGSLFRVGDGIYTKSDGYYGFQGTQTTIREIDGNSLFLADPLQSDVHCASNGFVCTIFPMIKGVNSKNVTVSDLTLEGNAENNHFLEGCRGGAIYLIGSKDIFVRRVKIHDFHGEGFSYQQCRNIWVEDSSVTHNRGNGLHPGSGTVGMVIRNCDISYNHRAGIHNCLRVSYQLCTGNRIVNNGGEGIEIGHRDDRLEICDNEITGNAKEGIFFREDGCPGMSGRYLSVHGNRIADNGGKAQIYAPTSVFALQMYENDVSGSVVFDGGLQDSFLWDNRMDGQALCKGAVHAKPQQLRRMNVDEIPASEYRHL